MSAVDEYYEFEYTTNGQIKFRNSACKKAINEANSLVVKISKGKADLPKLDGLLLIKGEL